MSDAVRPAAAYRILSIGPESTASWKAKPGSTDCRCRQPPRKKRKNSLHFLGLEGGDRLKSDLSLLLTLWRNCLHRFPISRRVISRINHDNGATM